MFPAAALLAAATASVVSPAAEQVSLTLYRSPLREVRQRMDLNALGGFALVTETRTIDIPAGVSTLRFEGVADGIIPASAVVTGLPGGTVEKNRDARLLSPLNLVDGTLGREVTVRRTDRETGKTREERATIIAVPVNDKGGVVVRTPDGIETWRCPGVPEKLQFDRLPPGLSARPVLSITSRSPRAARVRVTLSYLSTGFDWSASYVATLTPDGNRLNLFAWATLANANAQSFPAAQVQIVAGWLNRHADREILAAAALLRLRCFVLGTTTSNLPVLTPYKRKQPSQEIVVTGMRAQSAPMIMSAAPPAPPPPVVSPVAEALGDLKLYRLPEAVTVASNTQKQVALLSRGGARFEKWYRLPIGPWESIENKPAAIILRLNNLEATGLGLPLPSGTTGLYQEREGTRLLLGLGTTRDTAKGETARIEAGVSYQVTATQRIVGQERRLTLSNANPFAVQVEVPIGYPGLPNFKSPSAPLERINGVQTWRVTLPANRTAELGYAVPPR